VILTSRRRPPSSRCDHSRAASNSSTQRSPSSTSSSSRSSLAPRRAAQLLGISTGHAGQLLVTAGQNIERLHGDGAFAALCGASPIPASSGRTTRHRLNYGGDRDANRTLHMIAVCRLRYCARTQAYAARRTKEGKTKREIIRCLKRYIARETYHTLTADLADLGESPPPRPRHAIAITCGAGFIGRSRRHLDP
jgi:Transposase IS116/IS110/IS902 family